MVKRTFRSIFAVTLAVLIITFGVITVVLYKTLSGLQKDALRRELDIAAAAVSAAGDTYFERLGETEFRLTLVAPDGTVLLDNDLTTVPTLMENHGDREEIIEALSQGKGESSRYSSTLMEKTWYFATLLPNGNVLRISESIDSVLSVLISLIPPFIGVFAAAIVLSYVLALLRARSIVTPLKELDLDSPLENETYDELSPLLRKIHKQHSQISRQENVLEARSVELDRILGAMNEALLLTDRDGTVMKINRAATTLFGVNEEFVGSDVRLLDRSMEFSEGFDSAAKGKEASVNRQMGGKEYRFEFSAMDTDGEAGSVLILGVDITDTAFAERNRREFTANVSHELKSPLQSIIGSAELLEAGLVTPEDTPRFVGHIKREASRMVELVGDIMELSRLDEGLILPKEEVDLCRIACEVHTALLPEAVSRGVTFTVNATPVTVKGSVKYIFETMYNLCDNGIKYNRDGGEVCLIVKSEDGRAVITVADTGIGIPEEHQPRIFERFYRVDKSHSKETGGTGLGLSIVKHAVQYHGGRVELESTPEVGTTVTVVL